MNEPELITRVPSVDDNTRCCSECHHPLPLTEEFFHRDPYAPDGFCPICKVCRKSYRQERRQPAMERKLSAVKFQMMKKAIDGKATSIVPTNEEIALEMMNAGDTVQQVMADMRDEYANAKPGSLMRVKLLDMKLRVFQKAAEMRPVIPLDQMSDEELELALQSALERQAKSLEEQPSEPE